MKRKNLLSKIVGAVLCAALLLGLGLFVFEWIKELNANTVSEEISVEDAQKIVDETFATLPAKTAEGAKFVEENTKITVKECIVGSARNVDLVCDYKTVAVGDAMNAAVDSLMEEVYRFYLSSGTADVNATRLQIEFESKVLSVFESAKTVSGQVTLTLYQQESGAFTLYLSDDAVDTCFGGILSAMNTVRSCDSVIVDGQVIDITNKNTLRTGIANIIALVNYDSSVPQTGGKILNAWADFRDEFRRNFIDKNMWTYLTSGLLTTLEITGGAILFGILLGFLVAVVRVSHDKNGTLPILNGICKVYLSVIRGTPVMVQLLIIYFVFLAPTPVPKLLAAIFCFGLNSGAYVAEIVRGGIMSVDEGQIEAGRSLGLGYGQTMLSIVIPQAFKASLPSLANEFIALLKETSVAFYIGVFDLTQAGLRIRSVTYSNFLPLIAVALIYWVIVAALTKLVSLLERRLRQSER